MYSLSGMPVHNCKAVGHLILGRKENCMKNNGWRSDQGLLS